MTNNTNINKLWINAGVIVTYDDIEQEFFNNITLEVQPVSLDGNKNLTTEFDILKQVINHIKGELYNDNLHGRQWDMEERLDTICKISISYYGLTDAKDIHDKGLDFVNRTDSKYYFQPDQGDMLEQMVKEATGIASKTRPYAVSFPNAVTK